MNKYIIKAALFAALAAPVLTSCELDQFPEGTLPIEKSWESLSDAANYNVGLLSALRGVSGGGYAIIPEVQADLFNATTYNGNPPYPTVHDWSFTSAGFSGDGFWSANYNLICNANNVIGNIDKVIANETAGGATEEELNQLNSYKATAYFTRAFAYTTLVSYYCKNYDENAATTLGLPLVESVDVNAKPGRSSLEATYAFIKEDIRKAKELFTNHDDATVEAPTYNATVALEARVALFSKDYDTAINAANEIIAKYPIITKGREFSEMWSDDTGSEIIYQPQQTLDERANAYSAFISGLTVGDTYVYTPSYIPSQGLLDLYEDSDYRKDVYFAPLGVFSTTESFDEDAYIFTKYPGNDALDKGTSTKEYYNMTKVFRVAEMYLIAAEAEFMKNPVAGSGLETLNNLRKARKASELSNLNAAGTLTEIQNEWAREMCGEGHRLLCLKRWGKAMQRMTPQDCVEGIIYQQSNVHKLIVPATDKRFVWEIPSNEFETNGNLEHNWPAE